MALLESGEMYLENIFVLQKEKDGVHAIDIAERMHFSRPSVSRGLNNLKAEGYIEIDDMDHIHLTDAGYKKAKKIYERHTVFMKFLTAIGVPEDTAEDDACKMEHVVSDTTFKMIKKHTEEIQKL